MMRICALLAKETLLQSPDLQHAYKYIHIYNYTTYTYRYIPLHNYGYENVWARVVEKASIKKIKQYKKLFFNC